MKRQFTKEEILEGQQAYEETITRDMQFRKVMYHFAIITEK